jgi:dTDP-4-dehydrorhamnose reductase
MLATDLAGVAAAAGYQVVGLTHAQLDVTQPGQVRQMLENVMPDVVVNTPGIGVDACEVHPEEGYRLHTWASGVIARQCQRIGSAFVYISTCGLFGDEVRFYSEYDPVHLKTRYSRSKFMGEQAAKQWCDRTFVIRPGWLFGGTPGHRRNFVYQRFLEAQKEPVVRSASDKFGSPTFTQDLAKKVLEILETGEYGLYHVSNSGSASRYEYVKYIVEAFRLRTPVEPVDSSDFPRAAPVPDCELLDNLNLKFAGLAPLGPWQEAISRYVATLKGNRR